MLSRPIVEVGEERTMKIRVGTWTRIEVGSAGGLAVPGAGGLGANLRAVQSTWRRGDSPVAPPASERWG